jgi:hypothetical protein
MDKKSSRGGVRKGAGRKPKVEELKFISKLDNIIDSEDAIKKLKEFIDNDNFPALKLYLEYRFGKPKEVVENINHNFNGELTEKEAEIIKKVVLEKY